MAEHELDVERYAARRERVQIAQHASGVLVAHHPHAQLGVGRVDRNVDGRDAHFHDALNLRGREVGERDVVTVQKRQPLVVVLEIQAFAQAARVLVDEAEDAAVAAAALSSIR